MPQPLSLDWDCCRRHFKSRDRYISKFCMLFIAWCTSLLAVLDWDRGRRRLTNQGLLGTYFIAVFVSYLWFYAYINLVTGFSCSSHYPTFLHSDLSVVPRGLDMWGFTVQVLNKWSFTAKNVWWWIIGKGLSVQPKNVLMLHFHVFYGYMFRITDYQMKKISGKKVNIVVFWIRGFCKIFKIDHKFGSNR